MFLLVALIILVQIFNSCRHEFTGDPCQATPFNLSAEKTDATPNQFNGTITATATGGSGFKFSLNGSAFQDTGYFSGLQPFLSYNIVARNSWGCSDTAQVVINVNDPCSGKTVVVSATKKDSSPDLNDGTITVTANGGSGFTYSLNGASYQSSNSFTGLAPGNYDISVKNSNGCTGSTQAVIAVNNPCAGITVVVSATKVDPFANQSDGSITAAATGGSGFTYSLNSGAFQASGTFTGLAAGNYTIIAKNSNGCLGTATVVLVSINPCAGVTIVVTTTQTNPVINQSNGSVAATATGSTGFMYSLNGSAFQTSGTFTGLAAGNYTITAKNSNGCLGSTTVTLVGINPCAGVTIVVTTTQVNPSINLSDGSITAAATGSTGFTYSLNGGPFQTSGMFAGLGAGNYTVTAKNLNGCVGTATVALGNANPCAGLTIVVTTTQVNPTINLSDGSITATATGSTGFTYSLNGGAFQASGTFTGLAAGNYIVTAKNTNGCLSTATVTLVSVNPCAGVTIVVTTTQVNPAINLSNGSITATATGSTGFTYSLNSGTFQTSGTFTGLAAGNYTVTAKNSNGCLSTATVVLVSVNPCATVTVTVTLTKTDPTTGQSNGSITAMATGSTGFTYSLNGGTFQTAGTFTGLAAGNYTVTAKSSIGCLGSGQITLVTVSLCASVNIIVTNAIVDNTPCTSPATGKVTVTATGSTGFTYNINGGAYQASNIFSALTAGNYTVGVKDVNLCTKTATAAVATVASGPLFAQMRTLISTRCNGSGCHMNGTTTSGYNFDNDCSIVTYWSQINKACVLYTLVKMPKSPQALLTTAEKAVITDWINAGHLFSN